MVSKKAGYINMDRDLVTLDRYKIEICDLYNQVDNELIAVKMGGTQKMAYVIDQIITAIESVKNNKIENIPTEMIDFRKATLWLVLDRKSPISSLGDLNSLILKLKLVDFYNKCRHYGITPSVKINYIK